MQKNKMRKTIEKETESFLKKGGRIDKCPVKSAKNSQIMGITGKEYLKQQQELKNKRRQNV